ncbi:fibrinogen C domain-containing protein 1-like [Calliphora vicina]|uniref:fibrinogen C domain-containing protein 1-like n=1 Tax=Calliphora vicina TaxID=7373 RepID=UPI00325B40DA
MLNFQSFCLRLVLISFIFKLAKLVTSDNECNKITIQGEESVIQKLFNNLNLMMTTIRELNTQIDSNQEAGDNYSEAESMADFIDMRIDKLPKKCKRDSLPNDCTAATKCTRRSGIYKIQVPHYTGQPFYVECDAKTDEGGWIVIQRRQDGSIDFYQNWVEYQKGFGDIDGEFFIGLDNLNALTNNHGPQELMVVMEDGNGTKAYAKYDGFAVDDYSERYKLRTLGKYSGTAGDSLLQQIGFMFSTRDRDYDNHTTINCAQRYKGAWWYNNCHFSNLNGDYDNYKVGEGINWYTFTGYKRSLKYVKMMIRRRRF